MSGNIAGHPGPSHVSSDLLATNATKLNSASLPAGRRVCPIPAWVPPTLKKVPIGITERASDCQSLPVVDSFEMANSIYKSKLVGRASYGSPPPRPKSNGRTRIHKKDNTSTSPIAGAAGRLRQQSCSPNRQMERDMTIEICGGPCAGACSKYHDGLIGTTIVSSPGSTAPFKADESILVDRHNTRNWPRKRDLFPCRDSPRPHACSPDGRRADLDFQRYEDLERRCDPVSWRTLSPVQRRHEESRLYERMIIESKHSTSKVRPDEFSLRI